jgi:hypothetical protein
MGRPKGERNPNLSLSQLQEKLENHFESRVVLLPIVLDPVQKLPLKLQKRAKLSYLKIPVFIQKKKRTTLNLLHR